MTKERDEKKDFCSEEYWEKKFGKDFESKMEKKFENWGKCEPKWHGSGGFLGGGLWFLGFIASAVYYIQQSDGFWMGVLGVIKACVWPAMLIYEAFVRLGM